jgi:hypothetical protein
MTGETASTAAQQGAYLSYEIGGQRAWVMEQVVRPVVSDAGYEVRGPLSVPTGSISGRTMRAIAQSKIVVAEVSSSGPNVMFEVGVAGALGKRVVVLTERPHNLPPHLTYFPVIVYSRSQALDQLPVQLHELLPALSTAEPTELERVIAPREEYVVVESSVGAHRDVLRVMALVVDVFETHLPTPVSAERLRTGSVIGWVKVGFGAVSLGRKLSKWFNDKDLRESEIVRNLAQADALGREANREDLRLAMDLLERMIALSPELGDEEVSVHVGGAATLVRTPDGRISIRPGRSDQPQLPPGQDF